MCPPDYFDVAYSINGWMSRSTSVDHKLAYSQWEKLVGVIQDAGGNPVFIPSEPGYPDLVFTANLGSVSDDVFVPARFRHVERRGESDLGRLWFKQAGFRIRELPTDVFQEGSGDAILVGGSVVTGYGIRSDLRGCAALAETIQRPFIPLHLQDDRFYHADLVLCPLGPKSALVAADLVPRSFVDGLERAIEVVPIKRDLAELFCANSVIVNNTLVMPALPASLRRKLDYVDVDVDVVVVDVSEFHKAGGSVRCMVLPFDVL